MIDPRFKEAYLNMGQAYRELGAFTPAVDRFTKVHHPRSCFSVTASLSCSLSLSLFVSLNKQCIGAVA